MLDSKERSARLLLWGVGRSQESGFCGSQATIAIRNDAIHRVGLFVGDDALIPARRRNVLLCFQHQDVRNFRVRSSVATA